MFWRERSVVKRIIGIFAAVYLLLNLVMRFNAIHNYSFFLSTLLLVGGSIIFTVIRLRPGFLKPMCFLLGFSLPLYGFQSYSLYNCIFEFLVSFFGCLLLGEKHSEQKFSEKSGMAPSLFGGFIVLAIFSLMLLPISSIVKTFYLWGVLDFSNAVFWATPENPLYSIAAGNRLVLFAVLFFFLGKNTASESIYRIIFIGCALSVVAACLLGLLNHFEIISLAWYRPNFVTGSEVGRLHSVFGNPGWFSEYVIICTPFILFLLSKITGLKVRLLVLSAMLVLIGASLLMTGSRMSWLAFACVVFFCYFTELLFYRGKNNQRITWPEISSSCKMVGLGVLLIIVLIGGGIFWVINQNHSADYNEKYSSQARYILHRMSNIVDSKEVRLQIWQEALTLVRESPLYGMGYEGYRRHQEVMSTIPESRFALQRRTSGDWDDTHNLYVQLIVNNGVIGLLVWLSLVSYVALVLYRDGVINRNRMSFVLLGSLGTFHLYGFAQSMIYVASNWFLFFLISSYAILVEKKIFSLSVMRERKPVFVVFVLVMIGGVVYGNNLQSCRLAERYGLLRYDKDRGEDQYLGFYQREDWGKDGFFRWSGKKAEIVLSGSGLVTLDFICNTQQLDKEPVIMDVMLNGQPIDKWTFSDGRKVTKQYFVPSGKDYMKNILQLRLSRTWIPTREKMGQDTRVLGVAVSEPRYM
jgi:O-antigen ligase